MDQNSLNDQLHGSEQVGNSRFKNLSLYGTKQIEYLR